MTLLCFLLDLRTLPPSLLRDMKQSMLQLANLYAVLSSRGGESAQVQEELRTIPDKIALCYLRRNRTLQSDELKIAYCPRGNFDLRGFHHAINNLPTDCFILESSDSDHTDRSVADALLKSLMNNEALYSCGERDIWRKVICVGCSLVSNNEGLRTTLTEAAERCFSVEFVILECDHFHGFSEELNKFISSISDMENCTVQTFCPSSSILCGLVKRWFEEIKNDAEEPVQAIFHFKNGVIGSTNQILCSLSPTCKDKLDAVKRCQACRCHGYPTNSTGGSMTKKRSSFCQVTCRELGACEMIEHALMVGDHTVLLMPSFHSFSGFTENASDCVVFNVIERTNLASLDEGVILGGSHIVIPAASPAMEVVSDEYDTIELNTQAFYGLSRCLFNSDQGLICSSTCNSEGMKNVSFPCFYLLQPSSKGTMLLRRLAASEEIWPIPETIPAADITLSEELVRSIHSSLSKVELRDYNPLGHERGFHQRLNSLVRESLHLGSIPADKPVKSETEVEDESVRLVTGKAEDSSSKIHSTKEVDEKTWRILERLEAPSWKKGMGTLPIITAGTPEKKTNGPPPVSGPGSAPPLRPIFQRIRRVQR